VIRLKITTETEKLNGCWGTGCIVDERHIITAAHVLNSLLIFQKRYGVEKKCTIEGYIKQALNEGKAIGRFNINIKSIRIARAFRNG
jgi:hypothetical protein